MATRLPLRAAGARRALMFVVTRFSGFLKKADPLKRVTTSALGLIATALLALPACNDIKSTRQEFGRPFAAPPAEKAAADKPQPNTEVYEKLVENPFQLASREPLSTFSADVDTASYSNVRRFLFDEGKLPPRDAVRVEELVNYFRYDYPQPAGQHPMGIHTEAAQCPWNSKHQLVRIALQGKTLSAEDMPPRN